MTFQIDFPKIVVDCDGLTFGILRISAKSLTEANYTLPVTFQSPFGVHCLTYDGARIAEFRMCYINIHDLLSTFEIVGPTY